MAVADGRLTYRSADGLFWGLFVGAVTLLGGSLALLLDGAVTGAMPPLVTGAATSLLTGPFAAYVSSQVLRPLTVTGARVRVPDGFRSRELALEDIAGVGLRCQRTRGGRSGVGWTLNFWTADGTRVQATQVVLVNHTQPRPPGATKGAFDPVPTSWPLPDEDPAVLAASKPGRTARAIHDFVLTRQGPGGLLGTRQCEKDRAGDGEAGSRTVVWSPDGTMTVS